MTLGMNAGFGNLISQETLAFLTSLGVSKVRQEIPSGLSQEKLDLLVREFKDCAVTPLFLVHSVPSARQLTDTALTLLGQNWELEIYNEVTDMSPKVYRLDAESIRFSVRRAGFQGDIYYGAIPNLNQSSLDWLSQVRLPADDPRVGVSFHRYAVIWMGDQYPRIAHEGHLNRRDEMFALLDVAKGRKIICSEWGFDVGTRKFLWYDQALSESDQTKMAVDEMYWFSEFLSDIYWYQLNDGPTTSFIDRYGLRTTDCRVRGFLQALQEHSHL